MNFTSLVVIIIIYPLEFQTNSCKRAYVTRHTQHSIRIEFMLRQHLRFLFCCMQVNNKFIIVNNSRVQPDRCVIIWRAKRFYLFVVT